MHAIHVFHQKQPELTDYMIARYKERHLKATYTVEDARKYHLAIKPQARVDEKTNARMAQDHAILILQEDEPNFSRIVILYDNAGETLFSHPVQISIRTIIEQRRIVRTISNKDGSASTEELEQLSVARATWRAQYSELVTTVTDKLGGKGYGIKAKIMVEEIFGPPLK
jgi:hypothetical protein